MYRRQMQHLPKERRVILVGKTGNGKSSTGNSILRQNAFTNRQSLNAVTDMCIWNTSTNVSNTVQYKVVDTPGLFDDENTLSKRALDIMKSIEICKHPHAFLLVFNAKNRLTTDEKFTIDMLRIMFGEMMFEHAIVVFTNGGNLSDSAFKTLWSENEDIVKIVKLCGNRIARIENTHDHRIHNAGRESIITMIEEVSKFGRKFYNYQHLAEHREVIEEHAKTYHGKGNVHVELSVIVIKLSQKLDSKIWKKMLVGGVIIGLGVGLGVMAGPARINAAVAPGFTSTVTDNAAAIGGAVLSTAWSFATKVKFW